MRRGGGSAQGWRLDRARLAALAALERDGDAAEHSTDRLLAVRCTVAAATDLLNTSFHTLTNVATGQSVTKASDISIPDAVDAATAALFGLHGLHVRVVEVEPLLISVMLGVRSVMPKRWRPNVIGHSVQVVRI